MTKYFLVFLLPFVISNTTFGQSLTYFFNKLPADCTPDLTVSQRDTLLQKLEFIVPGDDSMQIVKYDIDTSKAEFYLRYEYSFTTGQRGFISFELRKFTKDNGQSFVVFSRYGGTPHAFAQHDLKIFTINNNNLIEESSQNLLPKNMPLNMFIKSETPDQSKKRIAVAVDCRYDMTPDKQNEIEFEIYPQTPLEQDEKWVIGYSYTYTWTGKAFERKLTDIK